MEDVFILIDTVLQHDENEDVKTADFDQPDPDDD